MNAKTLPFPEAMSIASTLDKYITKDHKVDAFEFVGDLIEHISVEDYYHCLVLMTGETFNKNYNPDGNELFRVFFEGLEANKIISLVESYRLIGFNR